MNCDCIIPVLMLQGLVRVFFFLNIDIDNNIWSDFSIEWGSSNKNVPVSSSELRLGQVQWKFRPRSCWMLPMNVVTVGFHGA